MHRATPVNSSFRAYSAGGARTTISGIDGTKLMQEIAGSFMKGESRSKVEAPSSYGFASLPFDADKDEDEDETAGPEAFVSFMGGNRSFPVCGPIDDRRHRLKGMEKGDVALFRGKDDGQQFHMNGIGTFLSTFPGKKLRLQVVAKAAQQAAGGAGGARAFAAGQAANDDGQAAGEQQQTKGQGPVYKNESSQYFEVTDASTESVNVEQTFKIPSGEAVHIAKDGKVYLGGTPSAGHQFAKVLCEGGVPSMNVYARIG